MDDARLDSFARGTVGAADRDFVRSENISADGLADISRERNGWRSHRSSSPPASALKVVDRDPKAVRLAVADR